MIKFTFEQYIISFPDDTKYEIFRNEWNHGIRFTDRNETNYEIVSCLQGNRLIINSNVNPGHSQDMPFRIETAAYLPKEITVKPYE